MKRIAWILLAVVLLVGAAQAAYVEMSAPGTITVGQVLEVTGSSLNTLKPGFSTDLILYKAGFTKTEVARTRIVVQEGGVFSASFPTIGLQPGDYLLELVDPKPNGADAFGGEAKTQLQVTLIDQQKNISITSSLTQSFTGLLSIRGSVKNAGNKGVQLRVDHGGGTAFSAYIATKNDVFSTDITIAEPGTYTAYFTDSTTNLYIGYAQFTVLQPAQTTVVTTTVAPAQLSASAPASRNQPAYFAVRTNPGTVTISTSSGIDWVMEYLDEDNHLYVVNEKGTIGGETATFTARGGSVYVKVYPFTFSDQGTVTLTASNAASVTVCTSCVQLFTTPTPVPTTTQKSPASAVLALIALAIALPVIARRR
ncbi:MAG TPA: hypothetical protein VMS81_04350 [Methanomicrobiales archaeon]|nr:hypothetical protein [Methanomicrobiales archaeon]